MAQPTMGSIEEEADGQWIQRKYDNKGVGKAGTEDDGKWKRCSNF